MYCYNLYIDHFVSFCYSQTAFTIDYIANIVIFQTDRFCKKLLNENMYTKLSF